MKSPRRLLNGIGVSRETVDRLDHFSQLFMKWARTINLVAPSTIGDLWERHIADSAQIFQIQSEPKRWVDLGSGGGFPGVITAILLAENSGGWVHLVESNQKKAAFLRVALSETGARGSVHPVRVENAKTEIPFCDFLSARALADLPQLLDYAWNWASDNPDMQLYLHKGRDYQAEIDKAHGRWDFDLVKHSSIIEQDSVVLEIKKLRRLA